MASAGCFSVVRQLEDGRVADADCSQCWQAGGQLGVLCLPLLRACQVREEDSVAGS